MLKIGWAARDFTPKRPAMLQGQGHVRVAREALDPLTVTAWAVEDVVFVSCDLCFFTDDVRQVVLDTVAKVQPEIPSGNVILSTTHTHASLVLSDCFYIHPGGDVMTVAECQELLAGCIASAVDEAWRTRAPRPIGWAFGHAVVGHNRYAVYADGTGAMYGQTTRPDFRVIGGYEDHSLDMVFTWEPNGRLAGLLLAIPCPSQIDENAMVFTADYWHDLRVELRRRFGSQLQVLAWCAPAGDQSPHFMVYQREEKEMRRRHGLTERQTIAVRVADAVERTLTVTKPTDATPVFRHAVRDLQLTPFQITSKEVAWAQARLDEYAPSGNETSTWWPDRLHAVIDAGKDSHRSAPVPTQIHVVRLGEIALATNPFELFLDYSLQIKARSPAAQTILAQLTAGGSGFYLPSQRAAIAGGYGAVPAVCYAGPEGGQELVEETLKTLNELFKDK